MTIQHNTYSNLLKKNRLWAADKLKVNPEYFDEHAAIQHPKFLFIGCSDSRVPLTSVTQSGPGEIFVHKNIANQINLTDLNLLSVIESAVEVLNIEQIIVFGHYKCGGVKAPTEGSGEEDIIENWVSQISDLYHFPKKEVGVYPHLQSKYDRLSGINVIAQLKNLFRTPILQRAFRKNKHIAIHGWVLDIYTGILRIFHSQ